jgi:hypothetical protein
MKLCCPFSSIIVESQREEINGLYYNMVGTS